MPNNKVAPAIDKGVHLVSSEELKTKRSFSTNHEEKTTNGNAKNDKLWYTTAAPTIVHYIVILITGLLIWGLLWFAWGDGWRWNGPWFRLVIVAVIAWVSGIVLQSLTTLPPLLAALLTGIFARNFGYLDIQNHIHIDIFLRKIYPVIILGKGSLAWDTNYMKENWIQIVALGTVPWTLEVATLVTCMHLFLGHPWIWGLMLGTFYASMSGPIVFPNVLRVGLSPRRTRNWPQFVATAGGTDTALSVGVFGILSSYLFSDAGETHSYRYFRAFITMFVGIALGVIWGYLAGLIPVSKDPHVVVEPRVLFVLFGGLFANFSLSHVGWGGVAGVAVLACNATAARYWAKSGWRLNDNPASTAYRLMWSTCEPVLFAYTGTFFVLKSSISATIIYGFAILLLCLIVRVGAAALMCWNLNFKEKIFICCIWSTKSIVEAVLCPSALNVLLLRGGTPQEMKYAEDLVVLSVQEILVTTPLAFLLTRFLGPILIKDKALENGNETRA